MLSMKERKFVVRAFAASNSAEQFDRVMAKKGLTNPEQVAEISDLIYAIATNKPVPKTSVKT